MKSNIFKVMKAKKKRAVDPNAPPRPNLLSHEKTIKDMNATAQSQNTEIEILKRKVFELERKLARQTQYLDALHQRVVFKR